MAVTAATPPIAMKACTGPARRSEFTTGDLPPAGDGAGLFDDAQEAARQLANPAAVAKLHGFARDELRPDTQNDGAGDDKILGIHLIDAPRRNHGYLWKRSP